MQTMQSNKSIPYSHYLKAAGALILTTATFLLAKSTGLLFGLEAGEESTVDKNTEQSSLSLRRSIEQATNSAVNQETSLSLQLVNASPVGSFGISDIQDMVIQNNIAYIAAGNNGFQVMDISNISNPIITGSYKLSNGYAHQLQIQGNYAYVAYDVTGLRIIDISNPSNLSLAGVYMMGTTNPPVTKVAVAGNTALVTSDNNNEFEYINVSQPSSIFKVYLATAYDINALSVVGNIAYVGGSNGLQSNGLQLINVSDPSNPILLNNFNIPGGASYVNVFGDIAYVSDAFYNYVTGLYYGQLLLIDVSKPSNLTLLSYFSIIGGVVSVVGNIAYLNNFGGLQLINVSDPSNATLLGNFTAPEGDIVDVSVVGNIAYMAIFEGLWLINMSDPSNLTLLGNFTIPEGYDVGGVSVVGNIAYVMTSFPAVGLWLINVADPSNPTLLGNFTEPEVYSFGVGVSVVGSIAFVAMLEPANLLLIDVNNSSNPTLLGNCSIPGQLLEFSVVGNIAYVLTDLPGSLWLINVSGPSNPILLGSFATTGNYEFNVMSVVDNIVYVLDQVGLKIFDVSRGIFSLLGTSILENKFNDMSTQGNTILYTEQGTGLVLIDSQNFTLASSIDIQGFVSSVSVVDNIAYVANGSLQLINVGNPNSPALLDNFPTPEEVQDVSVIGNIAYMIAEGYGLQLINVSNPSNPTLLGNFTSPYYGSYDVSVVGNIAYLANNSADLSSADLLLINVSNPSNLTLLGNFTSPLYNLNSISVVGNIAYVTGSQLINVVGDLIYERSGLWLINVADPSNATLLGNFTAPEDTYGVSVVGNIAYVTNYGRVALQLLDVSDPSNPTLLGNFYTLDEQGANSIVVVDSIAYLTDVNAYLSDWNAVLRLINVSDPTCPQFVRNYNTPGQQATQVAISNSFAYVANYDQGLCIIDLSQQTTFSTAQTASQITAQNNTAYLSDSGKNLYVLDITNTTNPIEIGHYLLASWATDMVVLGNYLYVAEGIDGIEIVDVDNAASPVYAGSITAGIDNARTLQINGNKLYVNNDNVEVLSFDMTVLHYLNISANNLKLIHGTTTITNSQFNVIAVNPFNIATGDIGNITYTISNLQQGQFELANTATPITSFTQAQINNDLIQFTYTGNGTVPSFNFTVNNGNITAGPNAANIVLLRPPQVVLNKIICNEGQTIVITSSNISATDIDGSYNPSLLFIVNNMGNSQFEFNSTPGVIVLRFTQQNVTDNVVRFVQVDGEDSNDINDVLPFYQLSVTNGQNQSGISNATIDFDATPKIIQNRLSIGKGQRVVLGPENLNATDIDHAVENLIFQLSNVTNGEFVLTANPTIKLLNFTQQQINDGQITFIQDGSDNSPSYHVNVTDGRATSLLSIPTVSFNKKEKSINTGALVGGVIGGVLGASVLLAGAGLFAKNRRDAATREGHPLANAIQTHLRLQGMDNFDTAQGQKFVQLVEGELSDALRQHGLDTMNQDNLAKYIAIEAKNKITSSTNYLGYSEITVEQLKNRIDDIMQAVAQKYQNPLTEVSLNDDEIELNNLSETEKTREKENYIPQLNLRFGGGYEHV